MTTTLLASFPSPAQGVWHLGPVPIRAYALFIIIGIVAALVVGDRRWEARGGERGVIYDIALWAVPFGLIGGRLYHVLTDWPTYFGADGAGPMAALRIWDGGLGIWGAVALGAVGAWIGCRQHGIPLPAFGDAVAPGIVLAQAIGRMGNYFNQELYGRPTDVAWGMEIFYRQDPSGIVDVHSLNGVSNGQIASIVHPTFLYELLWNLLVFAALIYVDRRFKIGHGRLFALYVAGYCVGRFGVELLRSDLATQIEGIRINSFTATFVFIGAIVYVILASKGREAPESLRGKHADADSLAEAPEPAQELVAVAATSGVVAAAAVPGPEDEAPDKEPEPEVELEPAVVPVVDDEEAAVDAGEVEEASEPESEPESEVELEPAVVPVVDEEETAVDAGEVDETPEDEAIVEAELLADGDVVIETAAAAEDAQLIDEDHDPVDENDLESLQDDAAIVVDGPVSEQQEELDQEDVESDLDDEQAPEDEATEDEATEDEATEDAAEEVAVEKTAEAEEPAPDQADVEAEVTADSSVVTETEAEAEDAELIDDDHDPVEAADLESLQSDDAAVAVEGPTSEQQEELAETHAEAADDDVATEADDEEADDEAADEDVATEAAETDTEAVEDVEPEVTAESSAETEAAEAEAEDSAPDESQVLADIGLAPERDAEVTADVDTDAVPETPAPAPTPTPTPAPTPTFTPPPANRVVRLGRALRRLRR